VQQNAMKRHQFVHKKKSSNLPSKLQSPFHSKIMENKKLSQLIQQWYVLLNY